jgi:endoglucanase
MNILSELCAIPTAPFAEDRVIEYVRYFAKSRPRLRRRSDQFGNQLLELPGASRHPRLVFVAHMDHPGLVARRMTDSRMLDAAFYGGVLNEYLIGTKVRFFDAGREILGTIVSTTPDPQRPSYPASAAVRVGAAVTPGSPGMFNLPATRISGGRFHARVCDDLAGAAAALTMLDQLSRGRAKLKATVAVLLTRAEEDGFIGAIASVVDGKLIRKTDRIISIECSAMQPYAKQGDGVILRVGDRTSIFNSSLMYFLHQQAEALKKKDKTFRYQRSLMPGGTCEATVFDAWGYTTGAVCVPLGNYHNMNREKRRIEAEYVDLADWKNMVKLFARLAKEIHRFSADCSPLRERVQKRFDMRRKLLLR